MTGPFQKYAITALIAALIFVTATLPLRAQSLLRDPDIEFALGELARPIITAAGLSPDNIRILVVNDRKLNAFVIDTKHVLIHSGLILKAKTAEELQAVIAHEIAHIANGHISRRLANMRSASNSAKFGLAMALVVGALSKNAEAAAGIALGSANSAKRVFLGHTRAEEASADQSALRYLAARNIDPTAMSDVLDYFRGQELLSVGRQDPYVRSHPLTRDRMRAVAGYAAAYGGKSQPNANANYYFARARAKLGAFTGNPGRTLRKLNKKDTSDIGLMTRAVALHRIPRPTEAIAEISKLLKKRPNDPYFQELKGQILLESGNFGAAVNAYGAAVKLAPRNGLILAGYGRALLALNTSDGNRRAVKTLEQARVRDGRDPRMMRDLAVAYARTGNNGLASLATAERYALMGKLDTAGIHAKRAADQLPRGSVGWNRAQDVLNAAKQAG